MIDELAKAACADKAVYGRKECARACVACTALTKNLLRRLREPTPEMFEAGAAFLDATRSRHGSWPVAGIVEGLYRTMIDAAMKQEPG